MIPSAIVVKRAIVMSVWLGTHLSNLYPPMNTVPVGDVVNVARQARAQENACLRRVVNDYAQMITLI